MAVYLWEMWIYVGPKTKLASETDPTTYPVSRLPYQEVAGLNLSFVQRISLVLTGRAYLYHESWPGWTEALPFYVFKCQDHGLVVSRPHGFGDVLKCPQCWATTEVDK